MKTRSIFFSLILLSSQSFALCIDKKVDPELEKVIREVSKDILDPKNEKIVPPGLPDGKYIDRSYQIIATLEENALVYFSFKEKGNESAFIAPYSYIGKSNTLVPVELTNLGNNDRRLWDVKTKIANRCKKPEVAITYDPCMACGEGNDLKGRFLYDPNGKDWSFLKSP